MGLGRSCGKTPGLGLSKMPFPLSSLFFFCKSPLFNGASLFSFLLLFGFCWSKSSWMSLISAFLFSAWAFALSSESICCLASLRSSRRRCQSSFCFCSRSGALCVISTFSAGVAMSDSGCALETVANAAMVRNTILIVLAFFMALTLKRPEKERRQVLFPSPS